MPDVGLHLNIVRTSATDVANHLTRSSTHSVERKTIGSLLHLKTK